MEGGRQRTYTCFKCGKSDHWARDCTVPPSEWIKTGQQAPQPTSNEGKENVPFPLGAPKKQKYKNPKLTPARLQDPRIGLPVVFLTFAHRFKKKFKGRGHEASDLRRLLEMYVDWQKQLMPHQEFDVFLHTAEQMGNTNHMKREMRQLRDAAIRGLDDKEGDDMDASPREAGEPNEADNPASSLPALPDSQAAPTMAKEGPGSDEDIDPFDDVILPEAEGGHGAGDDGPDDKLMDELMDEFY